MKIDTTLGELANAEGALLNVLKVKFDKTGGAKLRYHVVKLARLVQTETKHYYDERNALIEKLGEGDPKAIAPTSPNMAQFVTEHKALADVAVTIPWAPMTSQMLEPYAEVTGADLLALGPLFVLDEVAEEKAEAERK